MVNEKRRAKVFYGKLKRLCHKFDRHAREFGRASRPIRSLVNPDK